MSTKQEAVTTLTTALRSARAVVAGALNDAQGVESGASGARAVIAEIDRALTAANHSSHCGAPHNTGSTAPAGVAGVAGGRSRAAETSEAHDGPDEPPTGVRRRNVSPNYHFLAVVCHDLKDPLAAILMGAAFLLKTMRFDDANPRPRRMIEAIGRSGERMNSLVKNLVDFARLEDGGVVLETRKESARELLNVAMAKLGAGADAKGVRLVADVAPELDVVCDAERVGQILLQLGTNALRYAPPESQITLSARASGAYAVFATADQGPGLSPDRLANIFDPQWHARQSPRDGTGLGIAIAKGLTEAQRGKLSVETAPGEGTTFRFTLPLA